MVCFSTILSLLLNHHNVFAQNNVEYSKRYYFCISTPIKKILVWTRVRLLIDNRLVMEFYCFFLSIEHDCLLLMLHSTQYARKVNLCPVLKFYFWRNPRYSYWKMIVIEWPLSSIEMDFKRLK